MTFDLLKCWQIFQENIVMFMSGVQVTLIYAIIGTVAGFIIGLILGVLVCLAIVWLGAWSIGMFITLVERCL